MRLLVSVASAAEASAALAGGADVIDAKDPLAGALGAVSAEVLHEISRCRRRAASTDRRPGRCGLTRPRSSTRARVFTAAGASLVKVGFAGIASAARVAALTAAAVRGAKAGGHGNAGVVAVAYADAVRAASLAPLALVEVAARRRGRGCCCSTRRTRTGPGCERSYQPRALAAWVAEAHGAGLLVALAGKLTSRRSSVRARCRRGCRGRARRGVRRRTHRPRDGRRVRVLSTLCAQLASASSRELSAAARSGLLDVASQC